VLGLLANVLLLPVQCDYYQFKCVNDGVCIDNRRRCDGRVDCRADASDEENCGEEDDEEYLTSETISTVTPESVRSSGIKHYVNARQD